MVFRYLAYIKILNYSDKEECLNIYDTINKEECLNICDTINIMLSSRFLEDLTKEMRD